MQNSSYFSLLLLLLLLLFLFFFPSSPSSLSPPLHHPPPPPPPTSLPSLILCRSKENIIHHFTREICFAALKESEAGQSPYWDSKASGNVVGQDCASSRDVNGCSPEFQMSILKSLKYNSYSSTFLPETSKQTSKQHI